MFGVVDPCEAIQAMDVATTIMQMIVEVNARTNYASGCRRVSGNTHAFDLCYPRELVS